MRIKKFIIQDFRSIKNSGEVNLEPEITVLIGKNESGKTNILKALESFNGDYEYTDSDLCIYSATKKKLESGEVEKEDVPIITIWFEIEKEDKEKLKEIHSQLTKISTIKITKFFDNTYKVETDKVDLEKIKIEEESFNKITIDFKNEITAFKEKLDSHAQRYYPFSSAKQQYEQILSQMESYSPQEDPNIDTTFNSFYITLRTLPNQDTHIQSDIESFIKRLEQYGLEFKKILAGEESIIDKILEIIPQFIYFNTMEELTDTVRIDEFLEKKEKYKTLNNLLKLAGLDVERLKDVDHYERLAAESEASATITGYINELWKQEKVNIKLRLDSGEIIVYIEDEVGALDPPTRRSQGFQWFLSFYINFTAGSKGELKNTVILLDDPGVYLHPSGQRDLLNTLEKISKHNQIIFTTHSPFLIDRKNLQRVRIVSKEKDRIGTKIEEKFYISKYDALEPIRASIGMTIGDSLFTTKKNILVEGFSDFLILEAFSKICKEEGLNHIELDNGEISIIPVGGAEKMPYFSTLLSKENLDFVVLLDHDSEGRKTKKELIEKFEIEENLILTLNKITENQGEDAEIEDLIDFELYLQAVNIAYKKIFKEKLGKEKIEASELESSNFSGLKKYFRKKKMGQSGKIDKIKVAKALISILPETEINKQTFSKWDSLFNSLKQALQL